MTGQKASPATWLSVLLVFAGCAVAFLSRSYFFYEGSEKFLFPAEYGLAAPGFYRPLRSTWWLLESPLLVLREFTNDLTLLSIAFGVPFTFLPAIAVLVVGIRLRQRPELFALALLGMCLAPLPWSLFATSSWGIVNQLSWVLIAFVVTRTKQESSFFIWSVVTLLFFTHALAGIALVAIGFVVLLVSYRQETQADRKATAALILAIGLLRFLMVMVADSEQRRLSDLAGISRNELTDAFAYAGAGFVALHLALVLASAGALFFRPQRRSLGLALQAVAVASLFAYWIVDPRPWLHGVDFHYWTFGVLPLLLGIFVLTAERASAHLRDVGKVEGALLLVPAGAFFVAIAIGSWTYRVEMAALLGAVENSPSVCVSVRNLPPQFSDYPVHGFVFVNNYLTASRTTRPSKVLMLGDHCERTCWQPSPIEQHLFDFGVLPAVSRAAEPCAATLEDVVADE